MTKSHDNAISELIETRRTINFFKSGLPPRALLLRGLELARWAPNHHLTEPWHFYLLSEQTKSAIVDLNAEIVSRAKGDRAGAEKRARWNAIPGWLVVTCDRSPEPLVAREDYAACCCAVHSLSLFLWSHGVGVKWTTGEVTRDPRFFEAIWADPQVEEVVGLLWYGYPAEIPVGVRKPLSDILVEI